MKLIDIEKRLTICPGCKCTLSITPAERDAKYTSIWCPNCPSGYFELAIFAHDDYSFFLNEHVFSTKKARYHTCTELSENHTKILEMIFRGTDDLSGVEFTEKMVNNFKRIMSLL